MDPRGFFAPYGLTTAEQCHARFTLSYQGTNANGTVQAGRTQPLSR